jgi:hypothetical protein
MQLDRPGIGEADMIRRRRPLLRAAAVAGGAYLAGKRTANQRADEEQAYAEQDARISQLEQQQAPAAPSAQVPAEGRTGMGGTAESADASLSDQLDRLMNLHSQGMLTDQEFSAAKAKLLGI